MTADVYSVAEGYVIHVISPKLNVFTVQFIVPIVTCISESVNIKPNPVPLIVSVTPPYKDPEVGDIEVI